MRFCLFNLDNAHARLRSCRVFSHILSGALWLAGCGGGSFTANAGGNGAAGDASSSGGDSGGGGDSSGATGGGGGASGSAVGGTSGSSTGGGGASAAGGSKGSAGSAGAGGQPATTCDCAAGSYCQDGTNKCRLCSDFSRLEFAPAEKLATLNQTPNGNARFPRTGSGASDLFYRTGADSAGRIWYAPNPVSGPGSALSTLSATGTADSGPLLAAGVLQQNFFFDHLDASMQRHIMVANWASGALTTPSAAPAPLNGTASDFSIAIAPGVARAYWMSTRNAKATADLLWVDVNGATTTPAVLDLEVQAGAKSCPRLGDDATPWVNSAGTLLLFRSESIDDNCAPNDSGAFDLYAAPLSKDTGLAAAPAVPLSALNNTGSVSTETDPSFSSDACYIYFASNNGTANFDAYRAARN
ncbi:MAG TPA: hypothetical protein VNW92_22390 [Polyangiaceae bacterium]|nr:hypothetical protein [Polyangiaceae bacterium]